jgi:hypothetical protein
MKHLIYQNGGQPISVIIAEKGEVYQDVTGSINKVSNKAPSHDGGKLVVDDRAISSPKGKGGIVLHDVTKILSASQNQVNSGKRKDSVKDDVVAINKDEAEEFAKQFGLDIKVRGQISPSAFFDKLKQSKDDIGKRIGKKTELTNPKDKYSVNSYEANMAVVNALPTDDDIFENVFQLQESKKNQSDVNFNEDTRKYGGVQTYQSGGSIIDTFDKVMSYPQKKMMQTLGLKGDKPSENLNYRADVNENGWEQGMRKNYPTAWKVLGLTEDVVVDPLSVLSPAKAYQGLKGAVSLSRLSKLKNGIIAADKVDDGINSVQALERQYGGVDKVSMMGYRDDSPYRNNASNMIQSNVIDMNATGKSLIGISNTGDIKKMNPYSGTHEFNGNSVLEIPMAKYGSDGDGDGNSYSPAQIKYLREQNRIRAEKIAKGIDYLKLPNIKPEDRTRIQSEIDFLKKDMVSLDLPDGTKKNITVTNDRKSSLKNSDFIKGADRKSNLKNEDFKKGDPSNLGEIPTDVVYKKNGKAGTPMTQDEIDMANGVLTPPPVPSNPIPISEQVNKPVKTIAEANPVAPVVEPVVKAEDKPKEPTIPPALKPIVEIDKTNRDLKWYDVAGDIMNLADASMRTSPILQQLDLPRIKLAKGSVDPQVNQVRQNYLSALSALNSDDTVGASNVNQLMTNANQQEIGLLAQGRNANVEIQNREEIANQGIIADETIRNLQLKEDFIKKVMMTDEAQRRQKLTSFQNLFDKVAKNNKFNKTESAFQSVFAKNFKYNNDTGRIEFAPSEYDPMFTNNVSDNVVTNAAKPKTTTPVKKK